MPRKIWLILACVFLTLFGAAYIIYWGVQREISNRIITAAAEAIKKQGGDFSADSINVYPFGIYSKNIRFIPPDSENSFPLNIDTLDLGFSIPALINSMLSGTFNAKAYGGDIAYKFDFNTKTKIMSITGKVTDLEFANHPISKSYGIDTCRINVSSSTITIPDGGALMAAFDVRIDFSNDAPVHLAYGIISPAVERSETSFILKIAGKDMFVNDFLIDSTLGTFKSASIKYEPAPRGKGFFNSGILEAHLSELGLKELSNTLAPLFKDRAPTQDFKAELSGTTRDPKLQLIE